MKQSIGFCQFTDAFNNSGRSEQFTYSGLKALFNYLEEMEEETGEEMELDVIALCCDFTEYASVLEFAGYYDESYIVWDTEPDADGETQEEKDGVIDYEATLDKIREETTVIDIDGTSFIIQAF